MGKVKKSQVAALKYMIFSSQDGTELSKRILAFLINQSEGFTKEVCLTLVEDREGYTADEIRSASCTIHTTHLNQLFRIMGTEFIFSYHYGDFDPTRIGNPFSFAGQFAGADISQVVDPEAIREGMPERYTFWLAKHCYSDQAMLIITTRKELERIDIKAKVS